MDIIVIKLMTDNALSGSDWQLEWVDLRPGCCRPYICRPSGDLGGCGPDLHCWLGWQWLLKVIGGRTLCDPLGHSNSEFGCPHLETLITQFKISLDLSASTEWQTFTFTKRRKEKMLHNVWPWYFMSVILCLQERQSFVCWPLPCDNWQEFPKAVK